MKEYTNQVIKIWEKESLNNILLKSKMEHSKRVAKYITILTKDDNNSFYGWVHDIGRIEQYHKIKCFDDNKYNHGIAGIDYIYKNNIEFLKEFEEAKNIIKYHSNYNKAPTEKKTKLLYYTTIADQLDNAITCKDYILEEEKNNSKKFIKENYLTTYFIEAIDTKNIYLDKKECKTYLDYFYFAFTLLLRSLNNDDIQKVLPKLDYKKFLSTFNFFKKLFDVRLESKIKNKVLNIIDDSLKDFNSKANKANFKR